MEADAGLWALFALVGFAGGLIVISALGLFVCGLRAVIKIFK